MDDRRIGRFVLCRLADRKYVKIDVCDRRVEKAGKRDCAVVVLVVDGVVLEGLESDPDVGCKDGLA